MILSSRSTWTPINQTTLSRITRLSRRTVCAAWPSFVARMEKEGVRFRRIYDYGRLSDGRGRSRRRKLCWHVAPEERLAFDREPLFWTANRRSRHIKRMVHCEEQDRRSFQQPKITIEKVSIRCARCAQAGSAKEKRAGSVPKAIRNRAWAAAAAWTSWARVPVPLLASRIAPLLCRGADAGRLAIHFRLLIESAKSAARKRQKHLLACREQGENPKAEPILDPYRYALAALRRIPLRHLMLVTVSEAADPLEAAKREYAEIRQFREASPVYVPRPVPTRPAPATSAEERVARAWAQLAILGVPTPDHPAKSDPGRF